MAENIYKGKVAVVTGAGAGLGRAIARDLAQRGAIVVGADINGEAINETAEIIRSELPGAEVLPCTADVRFSEQVRVVVYSAKERYGSVDFMFNIAGVAYVKEEREISIETWDWLIGIDLMGVVYGTHYAYEIMRKQKTGHIVNMSSILGLTPFLWSSAYCTAKYGVTGMSLSVRIEAERRGVNVCAVCAAGIKTQMMDLRDPNELIQEMYGRFLEHIHMYTAEDTAKKILNQLPKKHPIILIDTYTRALWFVYRYLGVKAYERLVKFSYRRFFESPLKKATDKRNAQENAS